ncbi:MAG: DNA-3-methyladenine glycosylase I [Hyphomicrobiaceae bacterium]|nr:DNA-3-methyladenine glycosylase I [Hyphomicrobiaceae bacterium]
MTGSMTGSDPVRCPWAGNDPLYVAYHDSEWGVPMSDDRALLEKLILEGFQSGLSWITILRKREHFRTAFADFDPERLARFDAADVARLMQDPGIVRNRAKIEAAITNARSYLRLAERTSLAAFLWGFLDGGPIVNRRTAPAEIPASTELSTRISKALKKEGFRFVGPTTLYAFMQSTGMVNDHLADCHRHAPCLTLQKAFRAPAT